MIRSLNIILFAFLFCSCENKPAYPKVSVVIDTLPAILTAGLGDMPIENIRNSVAKKYGFRFLRVGGCVVSKMLSDSMIRNNRTLYKKLEKIHGKNFYNKFYEKVDLLSTLQYQVEHFLNKNSSIISKNHELGKEPYAMSYEIDPEIENSILNIYAYDWIKIDGNFYKRIFYTVSMDTLNNLRLHELTD